MPGNHSVKEIFCDVATKRSDIHTMFKKLQSAPRPFLCLHPDLVVEMHVKDLGFSGIEL